MKRADADPGGYRSPMILLPEARGKEHQEPRRDGRLVTVAGRDYLTVDDPLAVDGVRWFIASGNQLSPWRECGRPPVRALIDQLREGQR